MTPEESAELVSRLENVREKKSMSRAEIADGLDVSLETYEQWIGGWQPVFDIHATRIRCFLSTLAEDPPAEPLGESVEAGESAEQRSGRARRASKKKARKAGTSAMRGKPVNKDWIHVTLEDIAEFRSQHDLSETETAKSVGVSVSALRNWTRNGKVASLSVQRRIAKAIQDYDPNRGPQEARFFMRTPESHAAAVGSTAGIVSAFLASGNKMDPSELANLIKDIKDVLESG